MSPIGVGIVGAGAVVQTVHLPTLARLNDLFTVRAVMDTDGMVAERVAARAGARATTDLDDLLADGHVDVVVICSPPEHHAAQTVAAFRAGKKAVLCEKPLATGADEAREIEAAARESGGLLLVGAMHQFDPAWTQLQEHLEALGPALSVRSSIVLPFNDRYETRAGQLLPRPAMTMPDTSEPAVRAAMTSAAVLGLAVHDLPLVNALIGRRQWSPREWCNGHGPADWRAWRT